LRRAARPELCDYRADRRARGERVGGRRAAGAGLSGGGRGPAVRRWHPHARGSQAVRRGTRRPALALQRIVVAGGGARAAWIQTDYSYWDSDGGVCGYPRCDAPIEGDWRTGYPDHRASLRRVNRDARRAGDGSAGEKVYCLMAKTDTT